MQYEVTARKVCVIGAGTMGSGIAAHLANLGFDVTLLDANHVSVADAFDRAKAARPPHFYTPETANRIRLGGTAENLAWVSEAEWVCEAIVERPDVKRALYNAIEPLLQPDAMITTNTSGLEISMLSAGMSESFRRRFLGTHFFNPPRYLKLLELIPTPETDPGLVESMARFLGDAVARRVILAKDTPGFIANRYGMWCMFHAIHVAEKLGLTIEEVDAITGAFIGRPKSGSFRLNDIVGLDVMRDIAVNLVERCPHDPHLSVFEMPNSFVHLLAKGSIGDKSGQGYYRREGKELLVLDLGTQAYRYKRDVKLVSLERLLALPLPERLATALALRDEVGEYLRGYLIPALRYADYLKEEISHSVLDFDRVMEWGFGWEMGPFSTIDAVGRSAIGLPAGPKFYDQGRQMSFGGAYVSIPVEPEFATLKDFPVIGSGENYNLRDLGDGVTAVSLTTKMGVISPALVDELTELLRHDSLSRLVFTSEARSFSAGFDLKFFAEAIQLQKWDAIDHALARLQGLGELLEKKNCVAAVYGHCLGAGLELALSCSVIAASPETQVGLPESRVGLIPGGRGATLARLNNQHTAKRLAELALTLTRGEIGGTADHARVLGYLRPTDITVYHPDRLLTQAKQLALNVGASQRQAWLATSGPVGGMIDRDLESGVSKGEFTDYDASIGQKLKQILARSTSYADSLTKERAEFIDLCQRPQTLARIKHMLDTNKPLRN